MGPVLPSLSQYRTSPSPQYYTSNYTTNSVDAVLEPGYSTSPQYSTSNFTTNSVDAVTQAFSQSSLGSSPQYSHIRSRDPTTTQEKFDPHYKVHHAWQFQWGKVFKVLWTEPSGDGGGYDTSYDSEISVRNGKHGEKHYEKVRRFVIVDPREGHCICL